MSIASDIQARIKSGSVKAAGSQQYGPKVGAGEFVCLLTASSFGEGQGGQPRGEVKLKVISGGAPSEIGGTFSAYTQTKNQQYCEEQIALWAGIIEDTGTSTDKIYDDATDLEEILVNTHNLLAKVIKRGDMLVAVSRKMQKNSDKYFDNKIVFESYTPKAEATSAEAPKADAPKADAPKAKKQW